MSSVDEKIVASSKNIPEVPSDKHAVNVLLGPIEKLAQDWAQKWLNRFFGVRAIRAYMVLFLLGFFGDRANIDSLQRSWNFEIGQGFEFYWVTILFVFCVGVLTLLDHRENNFWQTQIQREKIWLNYIQNIQPYISDPEKRMQYMYTVIYGDSPKGLQDYFIKTLGPQLSSLEESYKTLESKFEPLDNLVREIKNKKKNDK